MNDADYEESQYEAATERYRARLARESHSEQQQDERDAMNFGIAASSVPSQPAQTQPAVA